MPNKPSAIKALRQSKKRAIRNYKIKTRIKNLVKDTRKAIGSQKIEDAQKILKDTLKAIDMAAQKKVLKRNTAARKKSRIVRQLNKLTINPK